jgi:V8-like Glu-specific endopeptidase
LISSSPANQKLFLSLIFCAAVTGASALPTTELVANTKPAIVMIQTDDNSYEPSRLGTGFFITPHWIATNSHVIRGGPYIWISDLNRHRYKYDQTIVENPDLDLAIIQVVEENPSYLRLDASVPIEGQNILVIGNPEGFQGTVSTGIVSSNRGNVIFQITAPTSPGSSGSPVLDQNGAVIGIGESQTREGQNINFAVRSSFLMATDEPNAAGTVPVNLTGQKIGLTEGEGKGVLNQLIAGGDLTRFGLYNAVTRASSDIESYDRATELERAGAAVVELGKAEWQRLLEQSAA